MTVTVRPAQPADFSAVSALLAELGRPAVAAEQEEGARGLGAGKALLQSGFAAARERGCHRVTLESGYSRQVAHNLYRNAGMTEAGYYFTRKP